MHVAFIPNRNSKPTVLLRETYREDGKVKHRTCGNISHLPAETIEQVSLALKGKKLFPLDQIFKTIKTRPHGHVEAILGAIKQLGLDKMIDSKASEKRNLVLAMIVQRIIMPLSKLGTTKVWKQTTSLADELDVTSCDQDDLYDAMDWLLKRQSNIENKLAKKHLKDGSMALYDISSSYFEGEHCPLAMFGYNRDGKKGKKIVVYGLLCNENGIPVSIQVYPGNTTDSTTVPDQAEKLTHQFHLNNIVLIGDRGMLTGTQIDKLKEYPGIKHISALRSDSIRKLIEIGKIERSLYDKKNLAKIESGDFPGERLIVCHNPCLEAKRRHTREELVSGTEKLLQTLKDSLDKRVSKGEIEPDDKVGIRIGKEVNKKKVAKHLCVDVKNGSFTFSRNEESIRKESELDGLYVIRTNVTSEDRSDDDVVRDYKRLGDVEKSFRTIKTTMLNVRPIHHRLEDRVRSHIFICMLSYYVVLHLRSVWAEFLYSDENLSQTRADRDPVQSAEPSDEMKAKKRRAVKSSKPGDPEGPMSFQALLACLATRSRNINLVKGEKEDYEVITITPPSPLQEKLLSRVKGIGQTAALAEADLDSPAQDKT